MEDPCDLDHIFISNSKLLCGAWTRDISQVALFVAASESWHVLFAARLHGNGAIHSYTSELKLSFYRGNCRLVKKQPYDFTDPNDSSTAYASRSPNHNNNWVIKKKFHVKSKLFGGNRERLMTLEVYREKFFRRPFTSPFVFITTGKSSMLIGWSDEAEF